MNSEFVPPPPQPPPTQPPSVDPAQQVAGPAVGLIVTAVIGGLFSLLGLLSNALGLGLAGMEGLRDLGGQAEWLVTLTSWVLGFGFAVIGLIIAAVVLFAAVRMKKLRGWALALTASILAMVPCVSPCCLLGLPIGIWSVVVLSKPEIKAAFG